MPEIRVGRIDENMARNKGWRPTPDQIIQKLTEGNQLLVVGQELNEVCRHLEVTESTWHRWVARYGGMKANDALMVLCEGRCYFDETVLARNRKSCRLQY